MTGGAGDDTYIVNDSSATIIETSTAASTPSIASKSFVLSDNVENLTLYGGSWINGTGNELANIITGNNGNNIINRRLGNDILTGGAGSDTFVFARATAPTPSPTSRPAPACTTWSRSPIRLQHFRRGRGGDDPGRRHVHLVLDSFETWSSATHDRQRHADDFRAALESRRRARPGSFTIIGTSGDDTMYGSSSNDVLTGRTAPTPMSAARATTPISSTTTTHDRGGEAGEASTRSSPMSATPDRQCRKPELLTAGTAAPATTSPTASPGPAAPTCSTARAAILAVGGAGNDTFVFEKGSGTDTIADFHVTTSSGGEHDLLQLSGYGQAPISPFGATPGRCIRRRHRHAAHHRRHALPDKRFRVRLRLRGRHIGAKVSTSVQLGDCKAGLGVETRPR